MPIIALHTNEKRKDKKSNNSIKLKHILNKVTLENFSADVEEIVSTFDVWEKRCISEMVEDFQFVKEICQS